MEDIKEVFVHIGEEKIELSLSSKKEQVDEVIKKIKQCEDISIGVTRLTSPLFAKILKKHKIDLEQQGIQVHCIGGAVC